ncbi:hypothetical protein ACLB1E_37035 [Escherichia coli]
MHQNLKLKGPVVVAAGLPADELATSLNAPDSTGSRCHTAGGLYRL